MTTLLKDYLARLQLGETQTLRNIVTIPIFTPADPTPDYLTLSEALRHQLATINEVNQAGQVPNIRITNLSEQPLLLVDGEELIGARQNRVLNTSILIAGKSESIVPVSCTEAGRWFYKSPAFYDAGFVSPHKLRKVKSDSVSEALRRSQGHKSDQHAVWQTIHGLHLAMGVKSPTSAMEDLFESKSKALDEYVQNLKPAPNQTGLVVMVNGEPTGCDVVSSARAYRVLHPKLIKSYALDALLENKPSSGDSWQNKVAAFFEACKASDETVYRGIGSGEDHQFEGSGTAGAALVVEPAGHDVASVHSKPRIRHNPSVGVNRAGGQSCGADVEDNSGTWLPSRLDENGRPYGAGRHLAGSRGGGGFE